MTPAELQEALINALETALEAQEIADEDDDDTELADLMRDIASECDGIEQVVAFDTAGILTRDAGLVVRMANGAEYQITIVQSRLESD
jgi:hypothetical protein